MSSYDAKVPPTRRERLEGNERDTALARARNGVANGGAV